MHAQQLTYQLMCLKTKADAPGIPLPLDWGQDMGRGLGLLGHTFPFMCVYFNRLTPPQFYPSEWHNLPGLCVKHGHRV